MKVSEFSYHLPQELIAAHPPKTRGDARLLVLNRQTGAILDSKYANLVDFLQPGDVLVLNDTKVMKSRLKLFKVSNGAEREIIVLEKHSHDNNWYQHHVMYRGSLRVGDRLSVHQPISARLPKNGEVVSDESRNDGHEERRRNCAGGQTAAGDIKVTELLGNGIAVVSSNIDLLKLTQQHGMPPLPPYMRRDATPEDIKRYQTVFAHDPGSAAAPTASLNMTKELLCKIQRKGVIVKYLTLHVGLGTFLPIRTQNVEDHDIHTEYFTIPADTIEAINTAKSTDHRVVAIGTTVTRTLEYAYKDGSSQLGRHGDSALPTGVEGRNVSFPQEGEADIYIYPGYKFKVIDVLLTNFHAPKSTVLMLAAAYAGWDNLHAAYKHAVAEKYNFLSYGDSMLII